MKKFMTLLLAGTLAFMPAVNVFAQEAEQIVDAAEETAKNVITAEAMTGNKSIGESFNKAAESTIGKTMNDMKDFVINLIEPENIFKVLGAIIMLILIWVIFKVIKKLIKKATKDKVSNHASMLISRAISYIYYIVVLAYILGLFGISLTALWGAAGIAGVAIGFAAQTSVSNLISGIFVLSEKAMKIGDFISVGGVSGTVDSIGLLSVKIHNLDNQMIRIPNSTIINSNFQNNSTFEVRRMSFCVSVAYGTDLKKALEELKKVPAKCSTLVQDPAPAVWYDNLGESGINMILAVSFKSSTLIDTKNEVFMNIVETLNSASIEIPYNKIDVNVIKA